MRRRLYITAVTAAVLAAPLSAHAFGAGPATGRHGNHGHHGAGATDGAIFRVGTAVEDITPQPGHPQYLGGFGQMAAPTDHVHDPLQVRGCAVAREGKLVEFAIVDSQGWFSGYQEGPYGSYDARQTAADWLSKNGYPG